MTTDSKRKQELRTRLGMLRSEMSDDVVSLGNRLNMTQRFQQSFAVHRNKWLIGSTAAGLVLALLITRKEGAGSSSKDDSATRSLFLGLLGSATKQILRASTPLLVKAAQTALMSWIARSGEDPDRSSD